MHQRTCWKLEVEKAFTKKTTKNCLEEHVYLCQMRYKDSNYGKCSKIVNASLLPKRHRQTGQTLIRLLLEKQSDQGLPCLLF